MTYHTPVMINECIEALSIKPNGTYLDMTFGGGGHAEKILKSLNKGKLIAFDQDSDVKPISEKMKSKYGEKFNFFQTNFKHFFQYLKMLKINAVDGILLDLGISSHQIDARERGFSTRYNADLDMRMNQKSKTSAYNIINEYDKNKLTNVLKSYGEIKNAKNLVNLIIKKRSTNPIKTTGQLKEIAESIAPKPNVNKYLARVFQAIRIEVNDEIKTLIDTLKICSEIISEKGRIVVLSYHSLEDRIVKNFFLKGKAEGEVEKDFYGNINRPLDPITKKPIVANDDEIERNNRARSAKLRVAKKRII